MNPTEQLWLIVFGESQNVFILIGMVIFMTIPPSGKREFPELGAILFVSLLVEAITSINIHFLHVANMNNVATNIFTFFNLPFAILLYRHRINWKNKTAIAGTIIIAFLLFALVNFFWIQGPTKYNSYTSALASVCFIAMSITYFFFLIRELPTEAITKLPMFWINSAMLIYYSGTFFIYLAADYLVNVLQDSLIATWIIHNFLGLIFYSMLWYAILLIRADHIRKTR